VRRKPNPSGQSKTGGPALSDIIQTPPWQLGLHCWHKCCRQHKLALRAERTPRKQVAANQKMLKWKSWLVVEQDFCQAKRHFSWKITITQIQRVVVTHTTSNIEAISVLILIQLYNPVFLQKLNYFVYNLTASYSFQFNHRSLIVISNVSQAQQERVLSLFRSIC